MRIPFNSRHGDGLRRVFVGLCRYFCFCFCLCCSTCLLTPAFAHRLLSNQGNRSFNSNGLQLNWLDKNISPSQNFYGYANGTFLKQHPVSEKKQSWNMWLLASRKNKTIILQLVEGLQKKKNIKEGSLEQKVRDFYASGMDIETMNKASITPLKEELTQINKIKNLRDLQAAVAQLRLIGVEALFDFEGAIDDKNSRMTIGDASAGGLSLPSAEYYTEQTKTFEKIRTSYVKYIAAMFRLMGNNPTAALKEAKVVISIETALAKASFLHDPQTDLTDYHPMTIAELAKLTPLFSWQQFFSDIKHPEITRINIEKPAFFLGMNKLLAGIPLNDWKIYLRWQLINTYAPYLSSDFRKESLRGQTLLTGTRAALSRAQQVIEEENNELSAALAKLYLEKTFTLTTKKAVLTILYHIRDVLKFELSHAHWMSKPTQIGALKKLDSLKFNIGYPEQGLNLNYSSLKIDRGLYVKNILRVNKFNAARSLNQIGKPDDQREWFFSPQTANATYSRQRNTLYISAGLLQPPFYAPRALLSVNYGALGSSIGHEMMHAFDYTGALYDSEGNVKNWWTAADLKKFHAALQCFSNQFSQYKGEGGLLVQGEKVRDEAAADLGGLILAYKAFHDLPEYKKLPVIEGFSPTQQFFLAFAHKFAENMTPGSAYRQISNDVHAPTQYRVNGTLANMQQFQQVFVISNDSPMVNQKRCVMW